MAEAFASGGSAVQHTQSTQGKLGPASVRWLAELPEKVRPNQTVARFPHIVNMLCTRWSAPVACRGYLEELLLDSRGDRKGFPPSVVLELAALKDYYESVVHPTQQTAWDELASHTRGMRI